jgi:uncharacterized membrane protein
MPEAGRRKSAIFRLLRQLVQDAIVWSEAEVAFTRADAKVFLRNYSVALGFIFSGLAVLIAAVFTLAQTIIGALASYVHGDTIAGLIVSVVLFGLTILLLAAARHFLTRKAPSQGMIFRRLTGADKE